MAQPKLRKAASSQKPQPKPPPQPKPSDSFVPVMRKSCSDPNIARLPTRLVTRVLTRTLTALVHKVGRAPLLVAMVLAEFVCALRRSHWLLQMVLPAARRLPAVCSCPAALGRAEPAAATSHASPAAGCNRPKLAIIQTKAGPPTMAPSPRSPRSPRSPGCPASSSRTPSPACSPLSLRTNRPAPPPLLELGKNAIHALGSPTLTAAG